MAHTARTRRRRLIIIALIVMFTTVSYLIEQGRLQHVVTDLSAAQPGTYRVERFVDGDTITVDMNGTPETIRFIGVDTPETHKPHTPVQCYGPAASDYTKRTIGSNHVRLEADSLSTNRDRYNRLLRYVYLPDGTLLNESLIQNGYGFYYPYFPFSKSSQFDGDERAAMREHKGLWASCKPQPTDSGGYLSNVQGT